MDSLRVFSLSAASGVACVRLVSAPALQSALLTLCAQSPVIYSFTSPTSDGANPHCAPLIDSSGRLFGTTVYGGTSSGAATAVLPLATASIRAPSCSTRAVAFSAAPLTRYTFAGGSERTARTGY
jgi:hypothetical protein